MPRTKQQNEIIKSKRKDLIVEAAIRVFATIPYTEVTISAIAREAKCGHSLIYHYFSNIREVYERAIESIAPSIKPITKFLKVPSKNPEIKFVGIITHLIKLLKTDEMFPFYIQALVHASNVISIPTTNSLEFLSTLKEKMIVIIEKGQEKNKIIEMKPEQILLNLFFLIRGIASSVIFQKNGRDFIPQASTIYLPFLKEDILDN